jgi:DNA-binding NtrC family response regulator
MTCSQAHGARILVVDGYRGWRDCVGNALAAAGYAVTTARSGAEGLRLGGAARFDLVLTEFELGDMTGDELGRRMRRLHPGVEVLYMAYDDEHALAEDSLLRKPFTLTRLEDTVRGALELRRDLEQRQGWYGT